MEASQKKAGPILKDSKKGMENGKVIKRSSRNATGRIMPGDDSGSDDDREDGEGNNLISCDVFEK